MRRSMALCNLYINGTTKMSCFPKTPEILRPGRPQETSYAKSNGLVCLLDHRRGLESSFVTWRNFLSAADTNVFCLGTLEN